jgi:two-component system sensor histidine kinase BarA
MKTGIRARILILSLVPATLTAVVTASYLAAARIQDLELFTLGCAQSITHQLASTASQGVLSNDLDSLQVLSQATLREAAVNSVSIEDNQGNVLIRSRKDDSLHTVTSPSVTFFTEASIPNESVPGNRNFSLPSTIGRVRLEFSRNQVQQRRQDIIKHSLFLPFLCLLLALILGYRTSRNIYGPLLRLDSAIRELRGNHRNSPERSEQPGGKLEGDIDAMVLALKVSHQHLQEQIEEATAELRQTLEELEIKNVELDIARKKAIQASQVKSEFLANMSHEIRTPMNGVMGFITLLSKTKLDRTQQDYLRTLRASAENLMVILNDVLDFSKIEAGKFKIRQRNFELRETLENAVLLFVANAEYKGLKLILDIEPDVPSHLVGDASRIAQIVTNFVSNAVKFTDQGEVEVHVCKIEDSPRDVTLNLIFRDTGIGIAPADQRRLFNPFYQLDGSITRRHGGTGLGLTISHRLVAMMNGKVTVQSQPGRGSVFTVTLKLTKQELVSPAAETSGALLGTVLIVSADPAVSRAISHIFEFAHIEVRCVEDFAAAVNCLSETSGGSNTLLGIVIDESSISTVSESSLLQLNAAASKLGQCKLILMGVTEDHRKAAYFRPLFSTIHFANQPPTSRELLALLDARPRPTDLEADDDRPIEEPSTAVTNLIGIKVLLADDNLINRRLARIFLNQMGAAVDEVTNGSEAIDACFREYYDFILMDIHMPEMDGLEATRHIRALKNNPNSATPIVALTADVMNQDRVQYLQAGMNDYLAKPITETALRQALEKWCPDSSESCPVNASVLQGSTA